MVLILTVKGLQAMLNIPYKITTELPLPTVSTNSYGAKEQISQIHNNRRFCISSITDKGNFKVGNQDSLLIKHGETALGHCVLMAVTDGVGGLQCGETTSRFVVEKLNDWWNMMFKSIAFKAYNKIEHHISASINEAIADINLEIYEKSIEHDYKTGTTLSLLFIMEHWYCIKHAGDSRVYIHSQQLQQLTEDDNLLNRYLRSGTEIEPMESYAVLANTLTKCIGVKAEIELSELSGAFEQKDSFMLCTDGLYKHIKDHELHKCIRKCSRNPGKSREYLQQIAYRARNRGESDDISAILLTASKGL
jgi:serine/threonine protein phosphatase PrpC